MTTALLIVFVIAALLIAGLALEKHTQKTRQEMMKELDTQEPEQTPEPLVVEEPMPEVEPTPVVEEKPATVKELVEQQEAPKPKPKRRRGRPAAKKD